MTQSPLPGLILPAPNDPTRIADNLNAILRWSKGLSPLMFGVGVPLVGTNPPTPPSSAYLEQGGFQPVVFASGVGTLTFPKVFPNGVLCINVNFADNTAQMDSLTLRTAAPAPTTAAVGLTGMVNGSAYTGTGYVSYKATGW